MLDQPGHRGDSGSGSGGSSARRAKAALGAGEQKRQGKAARQPSGRKAADALIERLYATSLDESLWDGLAAELARTMDSTSTVLALVRPATGQSLFLSNTSNIGPATIEAYGAYWAPRDVWAQRAVAAGLGRVWASKDLITDAELRKTEIYNDLLVKADIAHVVGAVFKISDEDFCVLGIHRPARMQTYGEADKRRVERLLPHVRRTLQIRSRIADNAVDGEMALDTIDRSRLATMLVTAKGALVRANHEAQSLLDDGDGLFLIGRRVAAANRAADERIAQLVQSVAVDFGAPSAGGAVAVPRPGRLPLSVLVAPFRPARQVLEGPPPSAIVFIRDPEILTPSNAVLESLYGFTSAEATIARALSDGKSVAAVARECGVSPNTVRTHLKSVFAKTGTNRQAALVAMILRSVATLNP